MGSEKLSHYFERDGDFISLSTGRNLDSHWFATVHVAFADNDTSK